MPLQSETHKLELKDWAKIAMSCYCFINKPTLANAAANQVIHDLLEYRKKQQSYSHLFGSLGILKDASSRQKLPCIIDNDDCSFRPSFLEAPVFVFVWTLRASR